MATAFQGDKPLDRRIPKNSKIQLAIHGNLFASEDSATTLGNRESTELTIKPFNPTTDFNKRSGVNMYLATLKAILLQTDITAFNALYLLAKAPHYLQVKTRNGEYFPFVESTATDPLAPNGSRNMGISSFKWMISQKERKMEVEWSTALLEPEVQYIYDNLLTENLGVTVVGAATDEINFMAYDAAKRRPSGFTYVKVNSVKVGVIKELSLEISFEGEKNSWEQQYNDFIVVSGKVRMLQTSKNNLLAGLTNAPLDQAVEFMTAFGEKFIFSAGMVTMRPEETKIGDKERYIELVFEGKIPFNTDEEDPDSITIDNSTKTITFAFETP